MLLKWWRRLVDHRSLGTQLVAVVEEAVRGRDLLAAGGPQVAQGDDVAVLGGEVDGRVDEQGRPVRVGGVGIDLRPDRPALAGRRVDHHDRLMRAGVLADVVDRHRARPLHRGDAVQARHLDDDRLPGAEAVIEVVGRGVDPLAGDVGWRRLGPQVDAQPGRSAAIGDRVVVVGEWQQAQRPLLLADEVAVIGVREVDRRRLGLGGLRLPIRDCVGRRSAACRERSQHSPEAHNSPHVRQRCRSAGRAVRCRLQLSLLLRSGTFCAQAGGQVTAVSPTPSSDLPLAPVPEFGSRALVPRRILRVGTLLRDVMRVIGEQP